MSAASLDALISRADLLLKRLEEDRFIWPSQDDVPTLTVEQLHWLLQGIDIAVVQRHPRRLYERVA